MSTTTAAAAIATATPTTWTIPTTTTSYRKKLVHVQKCHCFFPFLFLLFFLLFVYFCRKQKAAQQTKYTHKSETCSSSLSLHFRELGKEVQKCCIKWKEKRNKSEMPQHLWQHSLLSLHGTGTSMARQILSVFLWVPFYYFILPAENGIGFFSVVVFFALHIVCGRRVGVAPNVAQVSEVVVLQKCVID